MGKAGRVLGIDVGKKRIGVAVSDECALTAQPLTHIKRTSLEDDLARIAELAREYSAATIVVGVPYSMDGTLGPSARYVLRFIDALRQRADLDALVEEWDERLSTVAVERVLIEGDVSRRKRKGVVDKLAAAYILQGWLDSRKGPSRGAQQAERSG